MVSSIIIAKDKGERDVGIVDFAIEGDILLTFAENKQKVASVSALSVLILELRTRILTDLLHGRTGRQSQPCRHA